MGRFRNINRNAPEPVAEPSAFPWTVVSAAALIVLAALGAYHNSFEGDFVFDDLSGIQENTTIQQLLPLSTVLSPPGGGETVTGRPLLNFSLAVDYAFFGFDRPLVGWHVTNLAIHILAALLLFGILRRTLLLPRLRHRWEKASTWIALFRRNSLDGRPDPNRVGHLYRATGRVHGGPSSTSSRCIV